ncbi:LacI family DNA-binding transcriptional regulator [Microbacterium sp. STN6]|uniref:LacI family DNA-binding transcriptional regulator n=1 Tax=Microbacterium sp. STN6 TaxID=2995588 RepID=UPI0022608941|nr:LacI family DNA-binding transcriptional regulator [Microbacterium sp. STN6]MCX7520709.1 LacI family DNA-binding transcriptional regulator [Microbacterium sp. STN6]
MGGIDEVARLAGVSTATVSRALSGNGAVSPATRMRVVDVAHSLGYVVSSNASSLASGRTKNVGAVVPFLNRWFFSSVIEGAERALLRAGYDLTLYNLAGGGDERRSVFEHFLLRKRVDAVIAISLELTEDEVSRLLALGKPVVGVGGPLAGVPTLMIDDVRVARLATEHLLALGHTRIGHIGGNEASDLDFHMPASRRTGYDEAMRAAGLAPESMPFHAGDFTIQGGYRAAAQLLGEQSSRPTAVFAASDEMAIGTILAARDLGLSVPHDVSVIGIDGHELAEFFGLTTVEQFPEQQGERAVELLMQRLATDAVEQPSTSESLPFSLAVRASTAPPVG